jgi:hypothetical protein
MAEKNSKWVCFLSFAVLLFGFAVQAEAESLKMMVTCGAIKGERFPVGDVEGLGMAYIVRDGAFVLENGEFGSLRVLAVVHTGPGKGIFLGVNAFTFADGSTIVTTSQPGSFWPDPDAKVAAHQKSVGEIINGTGRFKGIKGTQTMTGKILKPLKGDFAGKAYSEFILDYTLSP